MDPTNQGEGLGSYVSGTSSGSQLTGSGLPIGAPSSEEKTLGMLAHIGAAAGYFVLFPFLAPLLLLLTKGKESGFVRFHAQESLNLQITGFIVSVITCGLGALIAVPVMIVLNIIAGLKANEGQTYAYPIPMFRFIK